MKRLPRLAQVGVLAAVATAAALAQQGAPAIEERVEVEFVLLDVIAYDKRDRLVTDLTREDFEVLENKRPVEVRSFDVTDLRRPVQGSSTVAAASEVDPSTDAGPSGATGPLRFILAVDLEFAALPEVQRTFAQLEEFLAGAAERPEIAWLPYSLERGSLLDDFERDPARVRAALERYRREYVERRVDAGRAQVRGAGASEPLGSADFPQLEARFQRCHEASGDPRTCILGELDLFMDDLNVRTRRVMAELEGLADRFRGRDSLNTILFVSPGFSLRPGSAAIELAALYLQGRSTGQEMARTVDRLPPGAAVPRLAPSFEEEFQRVVHACVRRRVAFHTFDLHGFDLEGRRRSNPEFAFTPVRVVDAYREHGRELSGGLRALAEQSGGQFFSGPTLHRMQDVLDRMTFVYTLGYPVPPDGSGEFRRIKVKCRRKGVRLMHRAGYFAR